MVNEINESRVSTQRSWKIYTCECHVHFLRTFIIDNREITNLKGGRLVNC